MAQGCSLFFSIISFESTDADAEVVCPGTRPRMAQGAELFVLILRSPFSWY